CSLARLFPASTRFLAISTPSTSAPSRAAGSAVVPSPHPRSKTLSPLVIPSPLTSASPLSLILSAIRVKSPFSQSALFGFIGSLPWTSLGKSWYLHLLAGILRVTSSVPAWISVWCHVGAARQPARESWCCPGSSRPGGDSRSAHRRYPRP